MLSFGSLKRSPFGLIRSLSLVKQWSGPYRDSYDYTRLLQRCGDIKTLKEVHAQIITSDNEQNQFLAAKLISRFAELGHLSMDNARKVFDVMLERDVVLWNTLIRGYAHYGPFVEALRAYEEMRLSNVCANQYTYPFLIKACAAMADDINGEIIHAHVVKSGLDLDLFVGNALLAFYAKRHRLELSRKVFDEMPSKDIVSWNSMIAGYAQNEYAKESLALLHQMLQVVYAPDHATLAGVLPALQSKKECGFIGYIIKSGMEVSAALGSGLIAMYANCGRLDAARGLFDRIQEKNIVVWNVIIRCYGMHGLGNEALDMFSQMLKCGIKPDGISFICVLSACSHAGLLQKGWELFEKMENYGIPKGDEHYACMVDLLGRAGRLDESLEFIKSMPVSPGKDVYGALLGACRIHSNLELAEEVAQKLFVLDPHNAGRYLILAKMYEDVGRRKDAASVRMLMREKQVKKPLGCSAIEVDSVFHAFGVEDEMHPMKDQIFETLKQMEKVKEIELVALQG
ncbi:hypothetical protein Syun_005505 [Stephania yunnanensis]|uniref:Pentatricopeptide repeat-containing protein n=1 Tax=Stephania yunnanensis TaxID=152371 RepID=A0AAP0Q2B4_9MAGN